MASLWASTTVVGNFAADRDVGRVSALRRFARPMAHLSLPDDGELHVTHQHADLQHRTVEPAGHLAGP
ncbi:hypothetical protein [Lentzea terrae]|uniref:hypothetical protein n=1 Tax=Lentzea terrae TaxID=2200761 RepID=UPI000DD373DF|nr:hypothetical protein [Lentzea terrae]